MLTREDDIDVHALRQAGVDDLRDRSPSREGPQDDPGLPDRPGGRYQQVDPFAEFAAYCGQRLADDPHLWASTLFDELQQLGYDLSYPTMTRALRARGLRPACEPCRPTKDRAVAIIEHPPGEETQWDWAPLPDPPEH